MMMVNVLLVDSEQDSAQSRNNMVCILLRWHADIQRITQRMTLISGGMGLIGRQAHAQIPVVFQNPG